MGKKKSAALIILITVVLVGLIFMSVATFPVSDVNRYNSLLSIIDLGSDLGGGYTAVYYPEGVISQEEYNRLVENYNSAVEEGENADDPADLYKPYKGIYLSVEDNVYDETAEDGVSQDFRTEFESAFRALQYRFEQKSYSAYSVKLQDDFTIRVDVPYTDENASNMFTMMSYGGNLLFTDGSSNEMEITSEYVTGARVVSATSGYGISIDFTSEGRQAFNDLTSAMVSSSSDDSSSSSSTSSTLYIQMGGNDLLSNGISISSAVDESSFAFSGAFTERGSAETLVAVINSALNEDYFFDIELTVPSAEISEFAPTMGENAALIAAVVIGVLIVAMIVFSLIKYKGMGLAHVYGFLTYAVALVLCLALIETIQLTAAGIVAIMLSASLMVWFNWYAFKNIRDEFATGKTLTASVKAGYKKSLAFTIDAHIVLLILSAALCLISTGTVFYAALIFVLGTVISAACTLALTRFYLYMFLAQPKNKIAFCNLKREETEDE